MISSLLTRLHRHPLPAQRLSLPRQLSPPDTAASSLTTSNETDAAAATGSLEQLSDEIEVELELGDDSTGSLVLSERTMVLLTAALGNDSIEYLFDTENEKENQPPEADHRKRKALETESEPLSASGSSLSSLKLPEVRKGRPGRPQKVRKLAQYKVASKAFTSLSLAKQMKGWCLNVFLHNFA